jgi:hypothetical protein
MQFTWKDDGQGNGPVTAFGREPYGGESSGTIESDFLIYGRDSSKYAVKGYWLVVLDDQGRGSIEKQIAYREAIEAINLKNSQENQKPFQYQKSEEDPTYLYVADAESIQGIQNDCLARIILGASGEDPIPVPNSVWKTDETNEDGEPVYVYFTMQEFLAFAQAYLQRASRNFGVKEYHKANLRSLLKDSSKSYEDIEKYSYENGWFM